MDGQGWFWIAIGIINVAFWSAVAPVFKALADRIRGGAEVPAGIEARLAALEAARPVTGETDAFYHRITDLEERLDFAERLLSQGGGEPERIEGPR